MVKTGKNEVSRSKDFYSEPMDSYPDTGTVQVFNVYTIPVTNKYQVQEMDQVVQAVNVHQNSYTCDQILKGGGVVRMASPLPSKSGTPAVAAAPNIVLDKQDLENPDPMLTITDAHNDTANLPPKFYKCKAQIGTQFGCTPLTLIYVYRGKSRVWDPVPDVITAHKLIKSTGIPNFGGFADSS